VGSCRFGQSAAALCASQYSYLHHYDVQFLQIYLLLMISHQSLPRLIEGELITFCLDLSPTFSRKKINIPKPTEEFKARPTYPHHYINDHGSEAATTINNTTINHRQSL
jgi:hypothetical protein